MESLSPVMMLIAVALGIILLFKILSKPIKLIFKLLINAAIGWVVLGIFNFFGEAVGFTLDINLLNALITGILGVPGVILLVLLKLL